MPTVAEQSLDLLRDHLSPRQQSDLDVHQNFYEVGKDGTTEYHFFVYDTHTAVVNQHTGAAFCLEFDRGLYPGIEALSLLLFLRVDEPGFNSLDCGDVWP